MMRITLDPKSMDSYSTFLKVRTLPTYRIVGRDAIFPDEYAALVCGTESHAETDDYTPSPWLFDYQRDIAAMAIRKRKFAVFADCGLGKTLILLEFARHCKTVLPPTKRVLIISPLMVVSQTAAECQRWYGDDMSMDQIPSNSLQDWLNGSHCSSRVGITNYEALKTTLTERASDA